MREESWRGAEKANPLHTSRSDSSSEISTRTLVRRQNWIYDTCGDVGKDPLSARSTQTAAYLPSLRSPFSRLSVGNLRLFVIHLAPICRLSSAYSSRSRIFTGKCASGGSWPYAAIVLNGACRRV